MKFYVYTLAYPDGRVFYVGKGQGDRIHEHEKEARSGKKIYNPYKVHVIRKIWAGGGEVVKEKVFETDDEQESFYIEREYINYFGRSNLTNLTDGGEGTSGYRYTLEHKQKLAKAVRAFWAKRPEAEKKAALEKRLHDYVEYVVQYEKYKLDSIDPKFDYYSKNKLYPTFWEDPAYERNYEEDVMDLDEFITSENELY